VVNTEKKRIKRKKEKSLEKKGKSVEKGKKRAVGCHLSPQPAYYQALE